MTQSRLSTLELSRENMKFSIGHFMIFSEIGRENLHGHNYNVHLSLTMQVDPETGLTVDYNYYKRVICALCEELNQITLIPVLSPYLKINRDAKYLYVTFNKEQMIFLHRDVKEMQMHNISVEELSQWFITRMIEDKARLENHHIQAIAVKVFSAPGQSGSAHYVREIEIDE